MLAPTIETPRLVLRAPAAEDFEAFAAFSADEETTRYLGGPMARGPAWRAWCTITGAWVIRGYSMFSVIEKSSGRWVGRVGPWMPEGWPGTEVGWGIAREGQRQGYAREAAIAAIDFAFESLGFATVIHCIDPLNTPSIALARSLGSTVLQTDVQAPAPLTARWDLYGQTRAAWQARRKSG
jgi:RimJ/RimL family protein N-acetyltransferase